MPKRQPDGVLHYLRKMTAVHTSRELADSELLERFAQAKDEAAFTILIELHGSMVLGVCKRTLPNSHDAEDACQATFLVLVRNAASIRKKTSLSGWLHGVACRVAVKMKRDRARVSNRERGCDAPAPKDPAAEVTWREMQVALDDELRRLPESYRSLLILCYLECMTRDHAAQQLGICVESSIAVPWSKPIDLPFDPNKDVVDFGKAYFDIPLVGLCDGSVRSLETKKLTAATLKNAICTDDLQLLGEDW